MDTDIPTKRERSMKPHLSAVRKAISGLRLFPKNHDFFSYYQRSAENIVQGAKLLSRMLADKGKRAERLGELKEIELVGDGITHEVVELLHHTFLTPFDRADMHTLIVKLDDVLDFAYYVGNRLTRYDVQVIPPDMIALAEILCRAAEEILRAVSDLKDLKNSKEILESCKRVKDLEHQADERINLALEDIFKSGWEPLEVMKVKELMEHLEAAADKCEDVANIIEGIILRHA